MTKPFDVERIPAELAARPFDEHGRLIAWAVPFDSSGRPMHGTNDGTLVMTAILARLCGLCGNGLGWWVAFVGDEDAVRRRIFVEPPMHDACARYAFAVCPYLRAEEGFAVKRERPGVVVLADRSRPERMGLYLTRGFRPYQTKTPPFIPASKADAPKSVTWF